MRSEPAILAQERLLASSGVEILHIPLPTVPGSRECSQERDVSLPEAVAASAPNVDD